MRLHIVLAEVHRDICEIMLQAAQEQAAEIGGTVDEVTWVPGSLETPFAVQEILLQSPPDAIIVLGVIEQGQTRHGDVIGHQVTSKLIDLQLQHRMPMGVALIGPGATLEHAMEKAARTAKKAVRVAVQMRKLKRSGFRANNTT